MLELPSPTLLLQAKNPTDSVDQVYLIIAVVLLQAIGLFHPKPDQRASSHLYHAMLVMVRSVYVISIRRIFQAQFYRWFVDQV